MTTNRRYAGVLDERLRERLETRVHAPATLPAEAYGSQPIQWTNGRPPVWVWIQWHDLPAQRVRGYVKGFTDRVCIVWVDGPGGGWEIVVWRNAVTHRSG